MVTHADKVFRQLLLLPDEKTDAREGLDQAPGKRKGLCCNVCEVEIDRLPDD